MPEGVVADIGWIVIAFMSGLGARALRLPPLVGYLTAGMLLAVAGVTGGATIERVGELGIALLLFIVGLDLRWKNLVRPEVVGAGTVHLVLFALLCGIAGWMLGLSGLGAAVVAISLGTSSLVLAAKALEAHRDVRAYHGRVAIGITLLQVVIATAALGVLGPAPSPWAAALLALPMARQPLHALLERIDTEELTLFFGLAVAVAGYLLAGQLGIAGELGALAAGALLAGHARTEELADTLSPLKDTFLAAFFLGVGLIGFPSMAGLAVVGGLLLLLLVKVALFFGVLVGFRLKARTAFMAALPLTTYSGFTLILGSAAVDVGALPSSTLTVLALATAGSYLLNALITTQTPALWRRLDRWLTAFERSGRHPDAQPQTLGHAQFLVIGMDRIGTAAYDYLGHQMQCVAGLDDDPRRISHHRQEGRRVLYADARDRALWEELDFGALQAVILTLSDQMAKLEAISALREAGFEGAISALTADPDNREALLQAGANAAYLSIEQTGQILGAYSMTRRADATPSTVTLNVDPEASTVPPAPSSG
jgi:predicted Kef-type K+ transport protein